MPIGLKPKIVKPDSPSVFKLPTVAMDKIPILINSNKDYFIKNEEIWQIEKPKLSYLDSLSEKLLKFSKTSNDEYK